MIELVLNCKSRSSGLHIIDGTNAGSPKMPRKAQLMIDVGATASADLQSLSQWI